MQQAMKAVPSKPSPEEYLPYFGGYIGLVPEEELFSRLTSQDDEIEELFAGLPEERGTFAYEAGKWTIKELMSHLIDGERHFMYRAYRISRGDATPLKGFEQDDYIESSHANERTFADLTSEFRLLREANLAMFRNLDSNDWLRTGTVSDAKISVRAIAYIMAGHVDHHLAILRERYLA